MKKTSFIYTVLRRTGIMLLVISLLCVSCTKDEPEVIPPTPITPAPATPPSGVIDNFVITDTVVAFYTSGTVLKWLVTGTNNQTVVTLNGVKVPTYGIQDTGPLKQTTTFTLAVNNGKQASVSLRVADSTSTRLWNNGKRLKIIRKEYGIFQIGSATPTYRDTTISDYVLDQRIYFHYSGSSKIFQKTANAYVAIPDGGTFIVSRNQDYFSWMGNVFYINKLDENFLLVEFDETQTNGSKLRLRQTYQFE
ncbi:MAG: hypothetical protein ABI581_12225 [Sediminibacterium sp.]